MNQALTDLLTVFKPTDRTLNYLSATFDKMRKNGQPVPAADERWLVIWNSFDSWVAGVKDLTSEEDMRQLAELIAIFDPKDVQVTEITRTGVEGPG